jgi:hypothetical protein
MQHLSVSIFCDVNHFLKAVIHFLKASRKFKTHSFRCDVNHLLIYIYNIFLSFKIKSYRKSRSRSNFEFCMSNVIIYNSRYEAARVCRFFDGPKKVWKEVWRNMCSIHLLLLLLLCYVIIV